MVEVLFIHVYKCKTETCWNYSRNVGKWDTGWGKIIKFVITQLMDYWWSMKSSF
jgi:hypothetical protein